MARPYSRFDLPRPPYLSDDYWTSVEVEAERLARSLDADDDVQVLGDAKCLVEAVAKVTLDINGTPAAPKAGVQDLVNRAHEVLRSQPGRELAREDPFGVAALQASRMASNLGEIRNKFGGGHGRARQPRVRDEMVDLALDGAFTWTRWALRRLGLFAEGRPEQLIEALIVDRAIFHGGELARRLESADLPGRALRHQRALGVAVGQRSATGTFVVTEDGVTPATQSADLTVWPEQYRIGLAFGLLLNPDEQPTINPTTLRRAAEVLAPVQGSIEEVEDLADRVVANYEPTAEQDQESLERTRARLISLADVAAADLRPSLYRIAQHLSSSTV